MLSLRTLLRSPSDFILRDEFKNPKGLGLPKLSCCPRVWALPCPKSAAHRSIVSVAVVPSAHRGVGWGNWATRTVRSKALHTLKKYICVQPFLRIMVVSSDSLESPFIIIVFSESTRPYLCRMPYCRKELTDVYCRAPTRLSWERECHCDALRRGFGTYLGCPRGVLGLRS